MAADLAHILQIALKQETVDSLNIVHVALSAGGLALIKSLLKWTSDGTKTLTGGSRQALSPAVQPIDLFALLWRLLLLLDWRKNIIITGLDRVVGAE